MSIVTMDGLDRAGRSELHYAALEGNAHRVRELLVAGAKASVTDMQGYTPLHFACQQNHEEAAAALLAGGAPVDVADAWGNTPLSRAVFSAKGDSGLVRLLIDSGADPDQLNSSGVSPREIAQKFARPGQNTDYLVRGPAA